MSERAPSRPAAGGARTGIASFLAALAAYYVLAKTGSPELSQLASTGTIMLLGLAAGAVGGLLGYFGKKLRDKYPDLPTLT